MDEGAVGRAVPIVVRTLRESEGGFEGTLGPAGFAPGVTESEARVAVAQSAETARLIERLPGVDEARVVVAREAWPDLSGDQEANGRRPRASVVVTPRGGASVDAEAVRRVVAGTVAGLRTEDVRVKIVAVQHRPAPRVETVRVGPFVVARESARSLQVTLALLVLGYALGALAVLVRRRRSA